MRAAGHTTMFTVLLVVATLTPIGSAPVAGIRRRPLQARSASAAARPPLDRTLARDRPGGGGVSVSAIAPIIQQAGATLGRRLSEHRQPCRGGSQRRVAAAGRQSVCRLRLAGSRRRRHDGANERDHRRHDCAAEFGYDGSGVGVAIIDSGVTPWHDDLADAAGAMRVDRFVDFVGGRCDPYDDYGHGTHVAGIIAGNGFDSGGARAGIAPGAHLIVLKALDGTGRGHISDVIAALDYAVAQRQALNIRVINLSVAAGVYQWSNADPLTLAAQGAVQAGIVVVAAAGNVGRSVDGHTRSGGITAPANAPWVLTVGASSHMGTVDRSDDTIATFTSRGPTAVDALAKPDIVAPGVGIESLAAPGSALYLFRGRVPAERHRPDRVSSVSEPLRGPAQPRPS